MEHTIAYLKHRIEMWGDDDAEPIQILLAEDKELLAKVEAGEELTNVERLNLQRSIISEMNDATDDDFITDNLEDDLNFMQFLISMRMAIHELRAP